MMKNTLLKLGNRLFYRAYPIYMPLFYLYKSITDRDERNLFKDIVKQGMVVVDVGANIGIYTTYFSHLVGPTGQVIAFEPSQENYKHLVESTKILKNTKLYDAAVGAETGTISLFVSADLNVDHRTYDSGEKRSQVTVPIYKLDDVFPPGSRVDILKIDVQGYEPAVIRGAERLIADNNDIKLVIEFWPYGLCKAKIQAEEFLEYINSINLEYQLIGYKDIDVKKIAREYKNDPSKYFNMFLKRLNRK